MGLTLGIALLLIVVPLFCAGLNFSIDRLVYRPLRTAPKLAALVSAIGASFVLMNVGQLWLGSADRGFPALLPDRNVFELAGASEVLRFRWVDLLVIATTVPIMIALTLLVRFTQLGRAMRATAQNPTAARLMGIDADRVIGATFLLGGALAGAASVIYCLSVQTIGYKIGYTNGLYAFTAAVLGGIGNIPGAVLGGLTIGLVRSLGSYYLDESWTSALVFAILVLILVFRPAGLLGTRTREKV
jgi:branched-chain amino acid transport system permease protein